jgi:predicted  nucleic acid-binding Zn-ribbon protein
MSEENKSNGHDRVTTEMVGLLREIRDEMRGTNARLDTTNKRVDAIEGLIKVTNAHVDALRELAIKTHEELNAFRTETRDELMDLKGEIHGTNERLDRLGDVTGQLGEGAEKTTDRLDAMALDVQRLEARVVKLETKPAARPRTRARR